MSVEENRNCNCGANNMIDTNYDSTENTVDCNLKTDMLNQIMSYEFAINELALYLDTHTNDEKALCLHNRYAKEVNELKNQYQKVFGPLTINFPCNKWRWIEEPWPWEGGN